MYEQKSPQFSGPILVAHWTNPAPELLPQSDEVFWLESEMLPRFSILSTHSLASSVSGGGGSDWWK